VRHGSGALSSLVEADRLAYSDFRAVSALQLGRLVGQRVVALPQPAEHVELAAQLERHRLVTVRLVEAGCLTANAARAQAAS